MRGSPSTRHVQSTAKWCDQWPFLLGVRNKGQCTLWNEMTYHAPRENKVYESSLKAGHSTKGPDFLGGRRCLVKATATTCMVSMTNPTTRTVQGKPILYSSCCTIAGNMSPPVALPAAANPMASDLLVLKYVESTDSVGQKSNPFPMPVQTPCARNNCQYLP